MQFRPRRLAAALAGALLAVALAACAPRQHSGMVVDPETGLQYGSTIERNPFERCGVRFSRKPNRSNTASASVERMSRAGLFE